MTNTKTKTKTCSKLKKNYYVHINITYMHSLACVHLTSLIIFDYMFLEKKSQDDLQ